MNREMLGDIVELPDSSDFESADYIRGIDAYLNASTANDTLRPYQETAFGALRTFFESGQKRGYITHPTGTGKTVLFVEFSKALQEAKKPDGSVPKILVVTPTKDLVHQTIGQKGEKGYGKFAPELKVGSFFSDSPERMRSNLNEYDVVVTTYQSFNLMNRREEIRIPTKKEGK